MWSTPLRRTLKKSRIREPTSLRAWAGRSCSGEKPRHPRLWKPTTFAARMRKLLLAHSGWSALLATNLQIRNASAADIAGMIALERVATTAGRWSEIHYHEMFEPGAPARLILILEGEGGAVLGFLVARQAEDEWELENIVIAAEVQRRGHAADLLKRFMEHARCSKAQS